MVSSANAYEHATADLGAGYGAPAFTSKATCIGTSQITIASVGGKVIVRIVRL